MSEIPIPYREARRDLKGRIRDVINSEGFEHLKHVRPKSATARARQTEFTLWISPFSGYEEPFVSFAQIKKWAEENDMSPYGPQAQRLAIKAISGGIGQIGSNQVIVNVMGTLSNDKFSLGRSKDMYDPVRVYMGKRITDIGFGLSDYCDSASQVRDTLKAKYMDRDAMASLIEGDNSLLIETLDNLNKNIGKWKSLD